MRKALAAVGVAAAVAVGGLVGTATSAVAAPTTASGVVAAADNGGDNHIGRLGLAGLTGLAGLFGYRKYKDHRARTGTDRPGSNRV